MGKSSTSKKRRKLSFDSWIDEVTIPWLASYFGIHPLTVLNWRRKRNDPRVDQMRRIKRLTKGRVGYDMMIDRRPISYPASRARKAKAGGR